MKVEQNNEMFWKSMAKKMRFEDGESWTSIAKKLQPEFPGMSEHQVLERVRRYLRREDEYTTSRFVYTGNNKFKYEFDRPIKLFPLGDLHIGASGFKEKLLVEYLQEIKRTENGYVILLGDLCDNAIQNSKGDIFKQTIPPQKQKEKVLGWLEPLRDRILFGCNSNHEERTFRMTGQDVMYDIFVALDLLSRYNFTEGFVDLNVMGKTTKTYATHNLGKGDAKLKRKAIEFSDIDIMFGGHTHDPSIVVTRQRDSNGKAREIRTVICNAWQEDEHYAIAAAYGQVSLLSPTVWIGENKKIIASI